MGCELKKTHWKVFFDNLNRRRHEWITDVEVLSPDFGNQVLSDGMRFNGVTVETAGDNTALDISLGESPERHQTHMIKNPTRVAFLPGDALHSDVVDIEEGDGTKTLLRFKHPMGLLVDLSEYEMVVMS